VSFTFRPPRSSPTVFEEFRSSLNIYREFRLRGVLECIVSGPYWAMRVSLGLGLLLVGLLGTLLYIVQLSLWNALRVSNIYES
jgi:hypothetical protein